MIEENNHLNHKLIHESTVKFVLKIEESLKIIADSRTKSVVFKIQKILDAFSSEGLGSQHFHSLNSQVLIYLKYLKA